MGPYDRNNDIIYITYTHEGIVRHGQRTGVLTSTKLSTRVASQYNDVVLPV